jgi:hypothetical protein
VQKCESYYYQKPNAYNYCVENCQKVNLFFKVDNNKCIQCEKYYDPNNNECLDTCLQRNNLEYSYPLNYTTSPVTPQKCLNKCPYYFETIINPDNSIQYICVDTCTDHINPKTKECLHLQKCEYEQYEFENLCYPECEDPSFKYIDTDTNECVLSCPSYLSKVFQISSRNETKFISICKSSCKEDEFRLEEKCLRVCPQNYSYIGKNNICHSNNDKCNGDPNGEKYYPINEAGFIDDYDSYLLYNCTDNCDNAIIAPDNNDKNYSFYTTYEPNECLLRCKDPYPYYLPNTHECINKCPEEFLFLL